MIQDSRHGHGRRSARPDAPGEGPRGGPHHRRPERRGGGRHGGRPFDYGDLRLLVLAMIGEHPRHGYELMKAIEARMAGSYTPSPGAIYPALAWLENLGFATPSVEEGSRKRYRITPQGEAFLSANKAAIDALQARLSGADNGTREDPPEAVIQGMDNLKAALRFRLMRGKLDAGAVAVIVKALDTAALDIERNS